LKYFICVTFRKIAIFQQHRCIVARFLRKLQQGLDINLTINN